MKADQRRVAVLLSSVAGKEADELKHTREKMMNWLFTR